MPRRKMTDAEKFQMKLNKQRKNEKDAEERDLVDIQRLRIPEPAYRFKVGDRVKYGAWLYTEVIDVVDDGKIYKCFSCTMHDHYGTPTYGDKIHYEAWYSLNFYRNIDDWPERIEEGQDIRFNYQQRDLSGLLRYMFSDYGIDLNPTYQRGNVWKPAQKVALIDSIFKNIDIGKFTVIRRKWGDNPNKPETPFGYEMLDGKQRLTAIYEFYCGRFQYKGMYYYQMHPRDREHLKHYAISFAETEPLTDEQKYRYFIKLNTTGIPVDEKHLRKVKELWLKEQLKNS